MTNFSDDKYYFPYQIISNNIRVPKAPIVYLVIQESLTPFRKTQKYPAIIDTGADATLVPATILSKLNLDKVKNKTSDYPK